MVELEDLEEADVGAAVQPDLAIEVVELEDLEVIERNFRDYDCDIILVILCLTKYNIPIISIDLVSYSGLLIEETRQSHCVYIQFFVNENYNNIHQILFMV